MIPWLIFQEDSTHLTWASYLDKLTQLHEMDAFLIENGMCTKSMCVPLLFFSPFWCCWTWPRAPVNWFSPSIGAGSGPATGLAAASQPMRKLWSIEQKFCIFQRSVNEWKCKKKQKKQENTTWLLAFSLGPVSSGRLGHWVVSPARHNLGQRFALKWSLGKHICLDRSTSELVKDNFVIHVFI